MKDTIVIGGSDSKDWARLRIDCGRLAAFYDGDTQEPLEEEELLEDLFEMIDAPDGEDVK